MRYKFTIYNRGYNPFRIIGKIDKEDAHMRYPELEQAVNKDALVYQSPETGALCCVLVFDDWYKIIEISPYTYLGSGRHHLVEADYEKADLTTQGLLECAADAHHSKPSACWERSYEHLFLDAQGNILAARLGKSFKSEKRSNPFRVWVREVKEPLTDYLYRRYDNF
tara:strand:- start:1738 stop:2238 length:501 start_codon:yes stop_codon:yes gene_type:complete